MYVYTDLDKSEELPGLLKGANLLVYNMNKTNQINRFYLKTFTKFKKGDEMHGGCNWFGTSGEAYHLAKP